MSVSYIKARPVELQERTNYRSAFSGFLKKVERLASSNELHYNDVQVGTSIVFLRFLGELGREGWTSA
jgi:hypothetical protein